MKDSTLIKETGQSLYRKAKTLIPGGNMLLSKRPEMFLPDNWPSYFSRAEGCHVWDLDGRKYIDMLMTPGTNILGYSHPEINEAVKKVIHDGNMSSLNAPEEVELADRLIQMHPWADMVKFARTGGEANAMAIRIARAASGKDKVAICGYHGWHDWYLATNLSDTENLSNHLLPGLAPYGVPKNLRNTVFPFEYNDLDALENILKTHEIGVVKMEVMRNKEPEKNFLQKVRNLVSDYNAVLIFDECTSGFRKTFGGLHKLFGVEPDLAMFGKALGNGFAVTAVIGREEIMQFAQSTFISSTFWTERIGSVAGITTLQVMAKEKSWEKISEGGRHFQNRMKELANSFKLPLVVNGIEALTTFYFDSKDGLAYKTFLSQEMLKKGFLFGSLFYPTIYHEKNVLDTFFDELLLLFPILQECQKKGNILELLDGPICHSGFKRLN